MASKPMLPVLVRRLILATTSVTEITMRAGEGVLLSGWDGLVRGDVDDPHVPRGVSAWELGTKKGYGPRPSPISRAGPYSAGR